MHGDMVDPK
jgi:hypothetical protein